jgi:hypothetical protein
MARGIKILIVLASVAMLAGIVLAVALPRNSDETKAQGMQGGGQDRASDAGQADQNGNGNATEQDQSAQSPDQSQNGQQPDGGSVGMNPGQGSNGSPGLVVNFPDPAGGGEQRPADGYQDAYGQWIADMTGQTYSLKNCYLTFESDGSIKTPSNYDVVFQLTFSKFEWQGGSPAIAAEVQGVLKLGNKVQIPLKIDLAGQVSEGFDQITGTFTAVPQVDAYAVYAQQGNFSMHR